MKISQLVEVLNDIKSHYGDKYIWQISELDFPCPRKMEIELCSKIKRTDGGYTGGHHTRSVTVETVFEYEGGVDVVDRSFDQIENF